MVASEGARHYQPLEPLRRPLMGGQLTGRDIRPSAARRQLVLEAAGTGHAR